MHGSLAQLYALVSQLTLRIAENFEDVNS